MQANTLQKIHQYTSLQQDEIRTGELMVQQCRAQLETMEQEVGQLIGDLADCLGRTDGLEVAAEPRENMCAQARQLTRGLGRIVREHEKCQANRKDLLREIDRLGAVNRGTGIGA